MTESVPSHATPFWTDTHCHLGEERYDSDLDEVLSRATEANVRRIVAMGDRPETNVRVMELAAAHSQILPVVGVHPHHANEWTPAAEAELRGLAAKGPLAIGEIGLDNHYDFSQPAEQEVAFLAQAEIARELGLPLVIHCREAESRLIELMRRHRFDEIGGVVHCFGGTVEEGRAIADLGFALGITGILTFKKNEPLQSVAREAPLESLLVETDGPYLAPIPHRGKRNEPAWVAAVAQRLAALRGLTETELAEALEANFKRVFRQGQKRAAGSV